MSNKRQRQLELPILTDVNSKQAPGAGNNLSELAKQVTPSTEGNFHKPASADDQSIYKSISDNYFVANSK